MVAKPVVLSGLAFAPFFCTNFKVPYGFRAETFLSMMCKWILEMQLLFHSSFGQHVNRMRLHAIALALLPFCLLTVKADALANATASPAPLETSSYTEDRAGTFTSEPPDARDEERTLPAEIEQPFRKAWLGLKLASWRLKNVHPHSVYTKLQLDKVDQDILSNPRFQSWFEYVERHNLAHPTKKVSIVEKLEEEYGDTNLAMMLEESKKEKDTLVRTIGTTLQREQLEQWKEADISPHDLYGKLQSHQNNPTGQAYDIWNLYYRMYNPGKSIPQIYQLHNAFGDAGLSLLLIVAKRSKETAVKAKMLQNQLEMVWLRKDVGPLLAFKHLMLDNNPMHLLDNPELGAWAAYANMYQMKHKTRVNVKGIFKHYYDADAIETILSTAKTGYGQVFRDYLKASVL